jgi:hypothetical protein
MKGMAFINVVEVWGGSDQSTNVRVMDILDITTEQQ